MPIVLKWIMLEKWAKSMELRAKMHVLTLRFILILEGNNHSSLSKKGKKRTKQGGICLSKELKICHCFGINCLSSTCWKKIKVKKNKCPEKVKLKIAIFKTTSTVISHFLIIFLTSFTSKQAMSKRYVFSLIRKIFIQGAPWWSTG